MFEKSLKVVAENNGSAAATNAPPPSPPPLTQSVPGLPSSPFSGPSGSSNGSTDPSTGQPIPYLRLPRMTYHDTIVAAVPRKVYANAHAYHINSISINSDGETYMSADDLRINLWNLNISDQSFSTFFSLSLFRFDLTQNSCSPSIVDILDIKPVNMEELTEVITAAEFHPVSCNLFCYSSSKGTVKLADMREQALCDKHAKRAFRSRLFSPLR